MDTGHWYCDFTFNSEDWFGFIYRIVELPTGKEYIGKKQFTNLKRKKIKGRKNKKHIRKQSDWKSYTGSSEHLNKSIEKFGIENYIFIIESLHKTKGSLYYAEARKQIQEDVLRAKLSDNSDRKYYNKWIASIKFLPPPDLLIETEHKTKMSWSEMNEIDKMSFIIVYKNRSKIDANSPRRIE